MKWDLKKELPRHNVFLVSDAPECDDSVVSQEKTSSAGTRLDLAYEQIQSLPLGLARCPSRTAWTLLKYAAVDCARKA